MAAAKKRNWFAIWTSVAVAAVVVGVGAAVMVANNSARPAEYDLPASAIDRSTGTVTVGAGAASVETFVDFMCPWCQALEQQHGDDLLRLASEDRITLAYRPVAILDRMSQGSEYSTRAANAFYCVADDSPKAVVGFVQALFDGQPKEGSAGLSDADLVDIAKDAGAGDITSCQADRAFADVVATSTEALPANPTSGDRSTPAVIIDGKFIDLAPVFASRTYFADLFAK